jgi:ligand-binding SRPBCC domain-containing protein
MQFRHVFQVNAPLAAVVAFHARSASMGEITPPPIIVRLHHAPEMLTEGDEMEFSLWLGPLPVRWSARIENVSASGFSDRQLTGPFSEWVHTHRFLEISTTTTKVLDEVYFKLKSHPFWYLIGRGMSIGLPGLFAYRAWKTKRVLER